MLDTEAPANEKRLKFLRTLTWMGLVITIIVTPLTVVRRDIPGFIILFIVFSYCILLLEFVKTVKYLKQATVAMCIVSIVAVIFSFFGLKTAEATLVAAPIIVIDFYFLLGRRKAGYTSAVYVTLMILVCILSLTNTVQLHLSDELLIASIMTTIFAAVVLYFYEGINVAYEQLLLEHEKSLHAQLVQNKKLAEDLAAEKKGVEAKVIARTKELHAEQAKLRASIEGMALGFALIDPHDKIVVNNQSLSKVFDGTEFHTVKELNGVLPNVDLHKYIQRVQKKMEEVDIQEVAWQQKILHVFLAPVVTESSSGKKFLGTVMLIEDITESKVLERSKDEFFSIASHELRTPLTAIKGNAVMMEQIYGKYLKDPGMKEMVEDIYESSQRLIEIVSDFLDVSGLEQGKIVFRPSEFDIAEVIERVIYEMRMVVKGKHIYLKTDTLTLGSLPKIWADKDRTKQIVYNLIGNAAKFTESGGITISAKVEKNLIRVSVTDTGRGIAADKQSLLFHKFQQAGESLLTRDTTRGTGLGLYICKMIVQQMGGEIQLDKTTEGKGSTFSFTLPIANESAKKKLQTVKSEIDVSTGMSHTVGSHLPEPVK